MNIDTILTALILVSLLVSLFLSNWLAAFVSGAWLIAQLGSILFPEVK